MGASSVTGVGQGGAWVNKGPGNNRTQYVSILDPHIVQHGTIDMDDGSVTVQLDPSNYDLPENLTILVSGKAWRTDKNVGEDGLCNSFDINGAKKIDVDYVVIKSSSGKFMDY